MMPQGMRRFVSTPRPSNAESDSVAAALPADLGRHALRREAVSAVPGTPLSSERTGGAGSRPCTRQNTIALDPKFDKVKKIQVQAKLGWRIVKCKIHRLPSITGLVPSVLARSGIVHTQMSSRDGRCERMSIHCRLRQEIRHADMLRCPL
jgi:hypothetical protein